jgi:hypothetical protein
VHNSFEAQIGPEPGLDLYVFGDIHGPKPYKVADTGGTAEDHLSSVPSSACSDIPRHAQGIVIGVPPKACVTPSSHAVSRPSLAEARPKSIPPGHFGLQKSPKRHRNPPWATRGTMVPYRSVWDLWLLCLG